MISPVSPDMQLDGFGDGEGCVGGLVDGFEGFEGFEGGLPDDGGGGDPDDGPQKSGLGRL